MTFEMGSPKVVTLGQQYNVKEKPAIILYTWRLVLLNEPATFREGFTKASRRLHEAFAERVFEEAS